MGEFDQARFDELMLTLKTLRERHAVEIAAVQGEITKVLFPGEQGGAG